MTDQSQKPTNDQPKRQRKPRGRSKGEGSVFKRSGGDRLKPWVAQITVDGKKKSIGYFKTESEAIAAKNKAIREVEQGTRVENSKKTLAEYLDYWLEHVHKPTIELTSYQKYRSALDGRLIPGLGDVQVQKLTTHQLQMFYSKLINEEGLGSSRIRYLHAILHCALDQAVRESLVAKNVCDGVKLPRLEKSQRQALTPEQAKQLLAVTEDSQLRMIVQIAVVTTLRRGELLALHWQDIDFTKRRIQVRRSLAKITGQGLVEKSPKTTHSKRDIALPLFVGEALKKHRSYQQEIRQSAGDAWQDHDLVFCKTNGTHIHPDRLDVWFKKLLKAASLPDDMHLHDLRHSAVTILLQMGVPAHVVQQIAGHSDVSMTLGVYGHVLPGQQEQAMEKWDDMMGDNAEERRASMQQQWEGYSIQVQYQLESLLKAYGEGPVRIAMNIINLLQ